MVKSKPTWILKAGNGSGQEKYSATIKKKKSPHLTTLKLDHYWATYRITAIALRTQKLFPKSGWEAAPAETGEEDGIDTAYTTT